MTKTEIDFDVDGTLYDRNRYSKHGSRAFENRMREEMMRITEERFGWSPRFYKYNLEHLKKQGQKEYDSILLDVSVEAQKKIPKSLYMKGGEKLNKMFKKLEKDYNLNIVSNASKQHILDVLAAYRVNPKIFNFILAYETSRQHKPSVDIFRDAIKMSRAPPNKHVFVGDDFRCDIVPAKAVGITTIWAWQKAPERDVDRKLEVDWYAPTIYDVPLIIRKL